MPSAGSAKCFAFAVAAMLSVSARAQLIQNGSFEDEFSVSTEHWTLDNSVVPAGWQPGESPYGIGSLAFNPPPHVPGGSAIQDFGVTALGQTYAVTFAFGQWNHDIPADTQHLLVTISNPGVPSIVASHSYTDDVPGNDVATLWQRGSFEFIGTGLPTRITFSDEGTLTGIDSVLALDDVAVTPVPEPALLAPTLLLGLTTRRPRRSAPRPSRAK